nr:flagellar assembly protein FliH [Bacillus piscicola]
MSRVIKAANARTLGQEKRPVHLQAAVPLFPEGAHEDTDNPHDFKMEEIKKIEQQAAHMKDEADRIMRQAEYELAEVRRKISEEEEDSKLRIQEAFGNAEREGYSEGYQKGQEEGRSSFEAAITEARETIIAAKEEYEHCVEKAEPVILDLALAVANRIMYTALDREDSAWIEIVKNAIQEVKDHEDITVSVAPGQYEETIRHREELAALLGYGQNLTIFPDADLKPWSCMIETPYGKVDAALDSQLTELKTKLHELLKEGNDDESSGTHS